MHFLQDSQKAYIFYAIRFLYAFQKKSRNKLCLEPHDTYVLFRTFFSQVNNKRVFFGDRSLKYYIYKKNNSNKIRLLEKQHTQIIAAKSARTFNRTCLTEGFTPFLRLLYINIYKISI